MNTNETKKNFIATAECLEKLSSDILQIIETIGDITDVLEIHATSIEKITEKLTKLEANKMKKIITEYLCPPTPYRGNDWVAYYEGDEEDGLRGWGATEQEAINDLKSQGE